MSKIKEALKNIGICVVIGVVVFFIFGRSTPEKTAKQFAKGLLNVDAEKCVSLLDDRVIKNSNYETKVLYTKALEDILEELEEANKVEYGSRWDFKVKVVDCFDHTPSKDDALPYADIKKAVVEITHKRMGMLTLVPTYETEYMTLYLVENDSKWYVASFAFSDLVLPSFKYDQ